MGRTGALRLLGLRPPVIPQRPRAVVPYPLAPVGLSVPPRIPSCLLPLLFPRFWRSVCVSANCARVQRLGATVGAALLDRFPLGEGHAGSGSAFVCLAAGALAVLGGSGGAPCWGAPPSGVPNSATVGVKILAHEESEGCPPSGLVVAPEGDGPAGPSAGRGPSAVSAFGGTGSLALAETLTGARGEGFADATPPSRAPSDRASPSSSEELLLREYAPVTFAGSGARGPADDPPYHSSTALGALRGVSLRPSASPDAAAAPEFRAGTLSEALEDE